MKQKGLKTVPKITDGETRIKAMKGGLEKYFSEMTWKIGKLEKMGWVKVGMMSDGVKVETEKIEIVEIPKEKIKKTDIPTEEIKVDEIKEYPTDDKIKEFLNEKGVKFHHATGTKKLRGLYDANTK